MKKLWMRLGISLIITVAGIILAFVCLQEVNVTSLLTYHDRGVYSFNINGPLVRGIVVRGEFRAAYDDLGMVKLRIRTYNRINTTHLRFEIREKGKGAVWATNEYATDRFEDGLLYPFGFPLIADSKGRTYEFSLESLDGTPDNAIGIVSGYHDVASQYVFTKSQILSGSGQILSFIRERALRTLTDPYTVLFFSMFLVPAVIYSIERYRNIMMVYALLIYTYIPLSMHANTILVLAASVAGIALLTRTVASRIYVVALLWLLQIPVAIAFGNVLATNRAATLVFFLVLIGGIISVSELEKK